MCYPILSTAIHVQQKPYFLMNTKIHFVFTSTCSWFLNLGKIIQTLQLM